ncbi:MAG: hypothetical protein BJ554DRAFT_7342 [Olpidium bornovanus]|uniref:Uncharacterized protein n=1 Tax=Olpidium bornovanus TaxID=278681 RepID=A0A8H7ZX28_9FUNG|nr:MAG: hypothetical protein BJ554DRAFT_7342 [Olpidium bornovanus]
MASSLSLPYSPMDTSSVQDVEGFSDAFPRSSDVFSQSSIEDGELLSPDSLAKSSDGTPAFELVGSSVRLRNLMPVKILRKIDGGYRPFEICFPAEILVRLISGLYGNYIGASGEEIFQGTNIGTMSLHQAGRSLLVTTTHLGRLEALIVDELLRRARYHVTDTCLDPKVSNPSGELTKEGGPGFDLLRAGGLCRDTAAHCDKERLFPWSSRTARSTARAAAEPQASEPPARARGASRRWRLALTDKNATGPGSPGVASPGNPQAGGLAYQKDYTQGLARLTSNEYLVLAGTFHRLVFFGGTPLGRSCRKRPPGTTRAMTA